MDAVQNASTVSHLFSIATLILFQRQLDANYVSSVYATRAVLRDMKRHAGVAGSGGARVVFTSSQAGLLGVFGYSAYSASKFALRGLAETLQMEVCVCE